MVSSLSYEWWALLHFPLSKADRFEYDVLFYLTLCSVFQLCSSFLASLKREQVRHLEAYDRVVGGLLW